VLQALEKLHMWKKFYKYVVEIETKKAYPKSILSPIGTMGL